LFVNKVCSISAKHKHHIHILILNIFKSFFFDYLQTYHNNNNNNNDNAKSFLFCFNNPQLQFGNGSRVLVYGCANITVSDISNLQPYGWLNDEIINNYMTLLKKRADELFTQTSLKCHFLSSFFYNKLTENNTGYNVRFDLLLIHNRYFYII
jgi:hypothetical protein